MQFHNKSALVGILTALCIVLGFMEIFIPSPIPFLRLGLANIPIMIGIFIFDEKKYVVYIALLKSFLLPIISGNFFIKIIVSMPSTIISTVIMLIIYKIFSKKITAVSIGAVGGYFHIIVQLIVIKVFFIKYLDIYKIIPYFSLLGLITGILTGIIVEYTIKNIMKVNDVTENYSG
ncbi:Gx transporter family protein [Deferribacterales bacterium Es71-Z0220]|uniref:Gx transporter family protein n=1 Tax=Deferrivibrio essentukiensis TaxID=2880922 RepID=UPI001F60AF34|nr:Gx transporter family protein [Deferrivibrio essentukiensis]MCB4204936.1 Gx transporter family protein [Deferrivibrio essentukiensis]